MEKAAFAILEFCSWAGIGRSKVYSEIGAGRLKAVKAGKRTLIPVTEAQRWLESLEPAEIGDKLAGPREISSSTAEICETATAPDPASPPGERIICNEVDITVPPFLDRRSRKP